MSLGDILFGRPLASKDARAEKIGPAAGIPIFGLDALSSAAYGPEAALTLLIPLGAAGITYLLPISISIIVLLIIVYFSYRQTIEAYPGGGSYTVARQNIGQFAGLLAAGGADDRLCADGRGVNGEVDVIVTGGSVLRSSRSYRGRVRAACSTAHPEIRTVRHKPVNLRQSRPL